MVVREVGTAVERLVLGGGVGEFREDDGEERGGVRRGGGGVFREDVGVVGYAGTAGVLEQDGREQGRRGLY